MDTVQLTRLVVIPIQTNKSSPKTWIFLVFSQPVRTKTVSMILRQKRDLDNLSLFSCRKPPTWYKNPYFQHTLFLLICYDLLFVLWSSQALKAEFKWRWNSLNLELRQKTNLQVTYKYWRNAATPMLAPKQAFFKHIQEAVHECFNNWRKLDLLTSRYILGDIAKH